jgi:hypothetical protein
MLLTCNGVDFHVKNLEEFSDSNGMEFGIIKCETITIHDNSMP